MSTKRKAETLLDEPKRKQQRVSLGFDQIDSDDEKEIDFVDLQQDAPANQTAKHLSKAMLSDETMEIMHTRFNIFLDKGTQILDFFRISNASISSINDAIFDTMPNESVEAARYLDQATNFEALGKLAFVTNFVRLFFPQSSEQFKMDSGMWEWLFYERG